MSELNLLCNEVKAIAIRNWRAAWFGKPTARRFTETLLHICSSAAFIFAESAISGTSFPNTAQLDVCFISHGPWGVPFE